MSLLLVHATTLMGSILELRGPSSELKMGGSSLSMSCADGSSAAVRGMATTADGVTLVLMNVLHTCVDVPITVPCVTHASKVMGAPLFHCMYSGPRGNVTTGPFMAFTDEIMDSAVRAIG